MLVNCKSCQKKFTVPDAAITEAGRLLQCGACGNKWTQYPVKLEPISVDDTKKETTNTKIAKIKNPKSLGKKKKRKINLYSQEYLKKKHGLEIRDSFNNKNSKKVNSGYNFVNYLIITIVIMISLLGFLNITKNFLIESYPFTEQYINSLYEALEISTTIILNLIN